MADETADHGAIVLLNPSLVIAMKIGYFHPHT